MNLTVWPQRPPSLSLNLLIKFHVKSNFLKIGSGAPLKLVQVPHRRNPGMGQNQGYNGAILQGWNFSRAGGSVKTPTIGQFLFLSISSLSF